jgi:FkbM family methyltransferase
MFDSAVKRIKSVLTQPDFTTNPVRAVWRRLQWRLHWKTHPHDSVVLNNWCDGIKIILPRSGSAAQIFYREFSSPGVVTFMKRFIQPGMTMLDIGAHIGEYSLIAASFVGSQGSVYAFEPQPNLAEVIRQNAKLNGFSWISVHGYAITDCIRKQLFTADPGSKAAWLAEKTTMQETLNVETTTLDHFCEKGALEKINLIKIDAAGNELDALKGGECLLTRSSVPALIVKLYHPEVTKDRFGYDSGMTVRLLENWNYKLYDLASANPVPFSGAVQGYCTPVLAIREKLGPPLM